MPQKITDIINFDEDYYSILGIDREDLPTGKDPNSKRLLRDILTEAYHKKLFEVHPDRPNGDEEKCKLVVKAHMILSDPIFKSYYDSGGKYKDNNLVGMDINWGKIGRYRKGSLADMIGSALFDKILNESGIENIEVKFTPSDETLHNYNWEFYIQGLEKELILTIIEDETEVLKLTSGDEESLKKSLPFKIYICLPSIKLIFIRDEDDFIETSSGYLDIVKGRIQKTSFIDADLLGTTNYDNAVNFINSGELKVAIEECKKGNIDQFLKKFRQKADNIDLNTIMKRQEMYKVDQSHLEKMIEQARKESYNN